MCLRSHNHRIAELGFESSLSPELCVQCSIGAGCIGSAPRSGCLTSLFTFLHLQNGHDDGFLHSFIDISWMFEIFCCKKEDTVKNCNFQIATFLVLTPSQKLLLGLPVSTRRRAGEPVSYPAVPLIEREGSTRKKESLLEGSSYQYSQPTKLHLDYPY